MIISSKKLPALSFKARIFAALVGISATTSLIIGLVLYYFAENRLLVEESRSLGQRSQLANASASEFLDGLRNPEDKTFPAPQTYADELVQSVAGPTGLGVLYVGPDGTPLATRLGSGKSLQPGEVYSRLQLSQGLIEQAEASSQGEGRLIPRDGAPRYIAVWPLRASDGVVRGTMVYYAQQDDLNRTLTFLRFGILGAIGSSVILAAAASMLLARQITRPLAATRDAAIRVASGDYSFIPVEGQDELGEVAAAFNYMAQEIEQHVNEIQKQKARLEAVLEASPEAVIATTAEERISMVNPAAAQMLGIGREKLGSPLGEAGMPAGILECLREAASKGASVREVESGENIYWAYAALMTGREARHSPGVILAVRDITEYRSLERAKTVFVSDVSHELRTPLTTIQSAVDVIKYATDRLTPPERRALELMGQELGRIIDMVEELLTLAQMDSHQYSLEVSNTSLEKVIQDSADSIDSKARRFGISIAFNPDGEHHCTADAHKLYQVFLNLLDNAIKHSEPGTHVQVSIKDIGEYIQVQVQDTGPGIPAEDLPQLFERFYRVDKDRSRISGGSGLGLAIVKEIVELHGGKVTVQSKLGEGSTFTVMLPKSLPAHPATYAL